MSVTKEDVQRVAELSRLHFSDDEVEEMTAQLSEITDYMSTLDEVDTAGVPPMTHVLERGDALRDDDADQRISRQDALQSMPHDKDGFVLSPKVMK